MNDKMTDNLLGWIVEMIWVQLPVCQKHFWLVCHTGSRELQSHCDNHEQPGKTIILLLIYNTLINDFIEVAASAVAPLTGMRFN